MKIIKVHNPTGHPYWQKNEYKIEISDGVFLNPFEGQNDPYTRHKSYEITFLNNCAYIHFCACGSGYGKSKITNKKVFYKLKDNEVFQFVGNPLEIPQELQNEINELGHK